ncbi:MAG: hypothetical protein ACE5IL_13215 [Myxococcota bacterium]
MRRHRHLYERVASFENLRVAARTALRGKRGRAAGFARRFAFALECDVSRYFPSIDHDVLLDQVERVVADARLLALVRHIVESHV